MKYKPNTDYIFECNILSNGIDAKKIEDSIKNCLQTIIKENNPKSIILSNESCDARENSLKLFSIIEELQCIIGKKILHIGRIPDSWKNQLKEEMKNKNELNEKRLLKLDKCIMIVIEGKEKNNAVIIDSGGIYSISTSAPK